MASETLTISVVIPVYSGEDYLESLVEQLNELKQRWVVLETHLVLTEAIFVLDEPRDGSKGKLREIVEHQPWVRMVELSRNYGQHSATVAGILYSSGDWVVTMDEDLQHRPSNIEALLAQACANASDVVFALPRGWVHGGSYRDRLSRLVKSVIGRLSGNKFVHSFNSFRLIRGDIARAASSICAQSTYFDVALTWFTQRIATAELDMTDERFSNEKKSGYRLSTLIQHAKRLILTSELKILRLSTAISFLTFCASVVYAFWILYQRFFSPVSIEVEGWTSLMIVLLAIGSVGIFMLGLIVEFLHVSMLQLQGKPAFFVVNRTSDDLLKRDVMKLSTT